MYVFFRFFFFFFKKVQGEREGGEGERGGGWLESHENSDDERVISKREVRESPRQFHLPSTPDSYSSTD